MLQLFHLRKCLNHSFTDFRDVLCQFLLNRTHCQCIQSVLRHGISEKSLDAFRWRKASFRLCGCHGSGDQNAK